MPWALILLLLILTTGCTQIRYYAQTVQGQIDVLSRRQSIEALLQNESLNQPVRDRLNLVLSVRNFAIRTLKLPDSQSFLTYADLGRNYAVKNLFAAEEFSTQLKRWCYPIIGCAAYRGYFNSNLLEKTVAELRQQGYDIYIGFVAAYSTLGWFNDPVFNTALAWPEYQLVGLIFHELVHQRIYITGDTQFNESLASAIERAGIEAWYQFKKDPAQVAAYLEKVQARKQVMAIIAELQVELTALYKQDLSPEAKRHSKALLFEDARLQFTGLGNRVRRVSGFQQWFSSKLNNAKLGSVALYNDYIASFSTLLRLHNGQYDGFYRHVDALGRLERVARRDCLEMLADPNGADFMELAELKAPCRFH